MRRLFVLVFIIMVAFAVQAYDEWLSITVISPFSNTFKRNVSISKELPDFNQGYSWLAVKIEGDNNFESWKVSLIGVNQRNEVVHDDGPEEFQESRLNRDTKDRIVSFDLTKAFRTIENSRVLGEKQNIKFFVHITCMGVGSNMWGRVQDETTAEIEVRQCNLDPYKVSSLPW